MKRGRRGRNRWKRASNTFFTGKSSGSTEGRGITLPFYQRKWSGARREGYRGEGVDGGRVRVMSYNLLAQSLVTLTSPRCPRYALAWKHRRENIITEICQYRPAIVCVQELDQSHFEGFARDLEKAIGTRALYKKRTGSEKKDGLAIFWDPKVCHLVDANDVEFYNYGGDATLDRHNVAQIVTFELVGDASERKRVVVGNTHILFNPKRGDIKLRQIEVLCSEIEKARKLASSSVVSAVAAEATAVPVGVLMMGDFNTVPGSALYHFISSGELECKDLDRRLLSGQWNPRTGNEWDVVPWDPRGHLGRGTCALRRFRPEDATFFVLDAEGIRRCRVGPFCSDRNCPFIHADGLGRKGLICRFGSACRRKGCKWIHPGDVNALGKKKKCPPVTGDEEKSRVAEAESGTPTHRPCDDAPHSTADEDAAKEESEKNDDDDNNDVISSATLSATGAWRRKYVHNLGLRSAYGDREGEPSFTTYHARFKGTVDYMWHDLHVECVQTLEMLRPDILDKFGGLPSVKWSSDHMSLCADFVVRSTPALPRDTSGKETEEIEKTEGSFCALPLATAGEEEWPSL